MPNGRPGDHPYTDIVVHKMDFFGGDIDQMIRDIAGHRNSKTVRERLEKLVWENRMEPGDGKTDRKAMITELEAMKAELTT